MTTQTTLRTHLKPSLNVLCGLILLLALAAQSATYTWDGGPDAGGSSANNNATTGANWVGDVAPATAGHTMEFGALVSGGNSMMTWDLNQNQTLFTFLSAAPAMTIVSNATVSAIQLVPSTAGTAIAVSNNSANLQTFNNVVRFFNHAGATKIVDAGSAGLSFGQVDLRGDIQSAGVSLNLPLRLKGSANNSVITGPLAKTAGWTAGKNPDLEKAGIGKWTLSGPNSTLGGTGNTANGLLRVLEGTLEFSGGNFTCGSSASIQGVDGGATLRLTGGGLNSGNLSIGRAGSGTGLLEVQSGGLTNSAELILGWATTGQLDLTGGEVNVVALSVGNSTFNGVANLDGGTLKLNRFNYRGNIAAPGTQVVNFNGTTITPRATNTANFSGAYTHYYVKSGGAIFDTAGFDISFTQPLKHDPALGATPDGGLTKRGTGTLTLAAANTYSGNTTISNGVLALANSGAIASSPVIAVASGATFDVSAVAFTLDAGQTLSGDGTVIGAATLSGTVAPGASIGTLTFGTAPALNGTAVMEINRNGGSPLADKIAGGASLSGTLTVTNIGAPLANGDTFDLFDGTLSGSFSTLNLPNGASHWNTSDLNAGGTIVYVNSSPVASAFAMGVAVGGSSTVPVIGKYAAALDGDSDVVTITAVSTPTNGIATIIGATNITYTSTGGPGSDSFTYTVSDGAGGTDTQTVSVTISSPEGFNKLAGPVNNGNGTFTLDYLGVPGLNYALDESPDLVAPYTWYPVLTNTASGAGAISYTVPLSYPSGSFRTRHVP